MEPVYSRIRERARRVVADFPEPVFYQDFQEESARSRRVFETHPVLRKIKAEAYPRMDNDLGHGVRHVEAVAIDAGTLVMIEGGKMGLPPTELARKAVLGHCAGILHDIKRKEKNHAEKGALFAGKALQNHPFSPEEIRDICRAIRLHTAFKENPRPVSGALVADCLHDADKFRWGPDNFTDTVWHMASFFKTPLSRFIEFYPAGMESLRVIRGAFRTETGRKYGPGFIDAGISAGEKIFKIIRNEFRDA